MLNPVWAYDEDPSKLTDSPLQILAIVSGFDIACANGLWQGVAQVIEAANTPVPASFEVNTRVKHPLILSEVQVTIVPCSWFPVYVPNVVVLVLSHRK